MNLKTYKCTICGQRKERNDIISSMPTVCKSCIREYFERNKSKILSKAKSEVKRRKARDKRERKDALKTKSDWLNDLQKVFNQYIRLRDKNKPCISCGAKLGKYYDAGHYWSVGGYSGLRFDESNCHAQCIVCNQHKHGNIAEYTPRLIERIGQAEFDRLNDERHKVLDLTISEIKQLITEYKRKIKEICND